MSPVFAYLRIAVSGGNFRAPGLPLKPIKEFTMGVAMDTRNRMLLDLDQKIRQLEKSHWSYIQQALEAEEQAAELTKIMNVIQAMED